MSRKPCLILLGLLVCCFAGVVNAQQKKIIPIVPQMAEDTLEVVKNTVRQIDLYDLLKKSALKKKVQPGKKDSITSKPVFSVIPALGYTLTTGLAISLSGNMEFRLSPQARVSTITAAVAITSNRQLTVPVESSIWTKSGNYVFIGDYRFYKYSQNTYGLGSNSDVSAADPMKFNFIRLYEQLLHRITGNLYLGAGFIFDDHSDISEKGRMDGQPSNYLAYGAVSHSISSGVTINGLFDSRDNSINASKGLYAAMQYRDNYRFFGSTTSWRSLIVDIRHYINFPAGSDNVLALWSYDWVVLSGRPYYLDLPATGWDSFSATGRGYIQGRFRGAQMVYAEAEYRYGISANGLLGGVVFVNAESFSAAPGTHLQSIQPAFGPGLRFKLNKVSKTNICIDYGFGREGSQGVFVSVGELF